MKIESPQFSKTPLENEAFEPILDKKFKAKTRRISTILKELCIPMDGWSGFQEMANDRT